MNNVIGRTVREFYKEKQIELQELSKRRQPMPVYLYK